uniref:Ubiquitin-like protease family profile domain-containing protein n=1 Tax=Plectus sambesii TaxID=2011161 RepID=A0A914XL89_9BILA
MRFAPLSWFPSNSAEQSSNGHSSEASQSSPHAHSRSSPFRKLNNGNAGRHFNGDNEPSQGSRSDRKRFAVAVAATESASGESQSMDDVDAFELPDGKPAQFAKRPRYFLPTAEEQRPARLGFSSKIGQFLSHFLPASSLDTIKNWVKSGSEPPNKQLLYSPLGSANMSTPSNGLNANGWRSRPGRSIPVIDLTQDENDVTSWSSPTKSRQDESHTRGSHSTSVTADPDDQFFSTPIAGCSQRSPVQGVENGDCKIVKDEASTSASGINSTIRLERHWDRHENSFLKSQAKPVLLRDSSIRRPGVARSTPRSALSFDRSDLSSRLGTVKTLNDSRQYRNRSLQQVINLEERERYRELLESLGAGNVSFTPKNRTLQAVSPEAPTGDRLKAQLMSSRNLLDQITADISSSRASDDSSIIVLDDEVTTQSNASVGEQSSSSTAGRVNRRRWSQEKVDELNRKLELDPSAVSKDIRDEFLPSTARRRQQALELRAELQLRHDARKQREKSYDDELRLRLRLEGLVLPEPEEEIDEFPELTDEANALVHRAWSRGDPNELFVEEFSQQIRRRDLLTLSGLEWLNDEVINFYMNMIMARSDANQKMPKVYAFVTFFYPKVAQGGHSSVKRWTRKVDIFSYDLLLVPVHLGAHWCLATIDFRKKRIEYYDSMGGTNNKCLAALSDYLCAESLDKKKKPFDMSGWDKICLEDIPQQLNGSDCGMFTCKFAEYASRCAKITFDQEHMPYFRRRMVYEICTKKLM